ncbi:MAG: hypothetical protein J7K46_08730 [Bacteroidales bacterium]|nr:hypothetical protein [Bacteroidales bacterium]
MNHNIPTPTFIDFPAPEELMAYRNDKVLNVNAHIHTPFSFSAFSSLEQPFRMAVEENVKVLGINDFNTMNGYEDFYRLGLEHHVFPLFNIEFIGLLEEEQQNGIRVNDPDNPGRTYFSGKGLRFPYIPPCGKENFLDDLVARSNEQVRRMVEKVNQHFEKTVPGLQISFEDIKSNLARGLVRERHVAKAIRLAVNRNDDDPEKQRDIYTRLFEGQSPVARPDETARLENEIRSRLLKRGGPAFIPEDPDVFLPVSTVRRFILESGGIPCYPVLLDNPNEEITDFEFPREKLAVKLEMMGIHAVEFIPGRNQCSQLAEYAEYFFNRGFLVLFGTEHNTPVMMPLTVSCRNGVPLPESLREISWRSSCVVAAHQYLTARGEEGYCSCDGTCHTAKRDYFIQLGKAVMGYFLTIR